MIFVSADKLDSYKQSNVYAVGWSVFVDLQMYALQAWAQVRD